jgi:hypothetical protein
MKPSGRRRPARRETPSAPPPPLRLLRTLLIGAAGLALPILLHAILLPVWGEGSTPLFVVFLLSLLPATGVAFVCAADGLLRIGYAMCIVVGAAFLSVGLHEARIFGAVPSIEATAAPARPAAAGFLLPGSAPRADLAREVQARIDLPQRDLRGRSSGRLRLSGRFTIVPVVGADWTPAQPVPVVAVLDHGPDSVAHAVRGARWDAGRGVLRLLPDPLRDRAVEEALRQAGWTAAPRMVVGRWVEDPRWARLGAAWPLLWLYGVALLGLSLVILSRHPSIASRLDRFTEGLGEDVSTGREILLGIVALTLPCAFALAIRHSEAGGGLAFLAVGFAVVPSLMITLGASRKAAPIGVLIAGIILVVTLPMAVLARGAGPGGALPSLEGARWADLQEATIVIGAGWLAWAALVILGRALEGRGGRAPR